MSEREINTDLMMFILKDRDSLDGHRLFFSWTRKAGDNREDYLIPCFETMSSEQPFPPSFFRYSQSPSGRSILYPSESPQRFLTVAVTPVENIGDLRSLQEEYLDDKIQRYIQMGMGYEYYCPEGRLNAHQLIAYKIAAFGGVPKIEIEGMPDDYFPKVFLADLCRELGIPDDLSEEDNKRIFEARLKEIDAHIVDCRHCYRFFQE